MIGRFNFAETHGIDIRKWLKLLIETPCAVTIGLRRDESRAHAMGTRHRDAAGGQLQRASFDGARYLA